MKYFITLIALLLSTFTTVYANPFTVSTYQELQDALATNNPTIMVNGTITLESPIVIREGQQVIIQQGTIYLGVPPTVNYPVGNLGIERIIVHNGGHLTLNNIQIGSDARRWQDAVASMPGAANLIGSISVWGTGSATTAHNGGTLIILNSRIHNRIVWNNGAAPGLVQNSKITNITTAAEGSVFIAANNLVTITNTIIERNSATTGGAILLSAGSTLNLTDSIIRFNNARVVQGVGGADAPGMAGTPGGGGINMLGGTMNLNNTHIYGNTSLANGGGIRQHGGTINRIGTQPIRIENNTATWGGGHYGSGSAQFLGPAPLHINNNVTYSGAAAIGLLETSTVTFTPGSQVQGNRGFGGGILQSWGALGAGNNLPERFINSPLTPSTNGHGQFQNNLRLQQLGNANNAHTTADNSTTLVNFPASRNWNQAAFVHPTGFSVSVTSESGAVNHPQGQAITINQGSVLTVNTGTTTGTVEVFRRDVGFETTYEEFRAGHSMMQTGIHHLVFRHTHNSVVEAIMITVTVVPPQPLSLEVWTQGYFSTGGRHTLLIPASFWDNQIVFDYVPTSQFQGRYRRSTRFRSYDSAGNFLGYLMQGGNPMQGGQYQALRSDPVEVPSNVARLVYTFETYFNVDSEYLQLPQNTELNRTVNQTLLPNPAIYAEVWIDGVMSDRYQRVIDSYAALGIPQVRLPQGSEVTIYKYVPSLGIRELLDTTQFLSQQTHFLGTLTLEVGYEASVVYALSPVSNLRPGYQGQSTGPEGWEVSRSQFYVEWKQDFNTPPGYHLRFTNQIGPIRFYEIRENVRLTLTNLSENINWEVNALTSDQFTQTNDTTVFTTFEPGTPIIIRFTPTNDGVRLINPTAGFGRSAIQSLSFVIQQDTIIGAQYELITHPVTIMS